MQQRMGDSRWFLMKEGDRTALYLGRLIITVDSYKNHISRPFDSCGDGS